MYSDAQLQYLNKMGIPAWEMRSPASQPAETQQLQQPVETRDVEFCDWLAVQPVMPIADSRERRFTMGPHESSLIVLSDAPVSTPAGSAGGQPFSTPAARMLDAMLQAIGLSRSTCRIGSLDLPGLIDGHSVTRLIASAAPRVVLQFIHPGVNAAFPNLDDLREASHVLPDSDVRCVVSYHPEYLLSNPAKKRDTWDDLKLVRTLIGPQS